MEKKISFIDILDLLDDCKSILLAVEAMDTSDIPLEGTGAVPLVCDMMADRIDAFIQRLQEQLKSEKDGE